MGSRVVTPGEMWREAAWRLTGYEPTVEQMRFHRSRSRLRLVAGGVRAGKSYGVSAEVHRYVVENGGLCWLVGPDYEQARPEFGYLLQWYTDMGLVNKRSVTYPSRGPCRFRVEFSDSWFDFATKSGGDPISLASYAPDVLVMCEAAQQPHEVFLKCLERATQKSAPVILVGTFESSLGWYPELWERWQDENEEGGESFSWPTWSNVRVFPGGKSDEKLEQIRVSMPDDLWQERYGAIPCKPKGLVFPQFDRKKHVKKLEELYDPSYPVELWVDPATHTYACLFVQVQGNKVVVLDEVYEKDSIAQDVIPKVMEVRWWPEIRDGVIDIAAKQRQGNKSQIQVWEEELKRYGTHPVRWRMNYWKEEVWRQAISLRLAPPTGEPLLFFADHLNGRVRQDGIAMGLMGELLTYKWPKIVEGRSLTTRPIKQNEDALSALGYGLLAHFGPVLEKKRVFPRFSRGNWR